METAQGPVKLEKEQVKPLALVFNGGEVATILAGQLEKQGVEVKVMGWGQEYLAAELPKFIFFFGTGNSLLSGVEEQLRGAGKLAGRASARMVLIYDNLSSLKQQDFDKIVDGGGWPSTKVEIRGAVAGSAEKVELASKLVRLAVGSRAEERVVIVTSLGRTAPAIPETTPLVTKWEDLPPETAKAVEPVGEHKEHKKRKLLALILVLLFLPWVVQTIYLVLGGAQLMGAKEALKVGKFGEAQRLAEESQNSFVASEAMANFLLAPWDLVGLGKNGVLVYRGVKLGELAANTMGEGAMTFGQVGAWPEAIMGDREVDFSRESENVKLGLGNIEKNLGVMEAELQSGDWKTVLAMVGRINPKVPQLVAEVGRWRKWVQSGEKVVRVMPSLIANEGRRTYLVVFQNSAELRPTGGFIGSYAIVHFDKGKLLDYKINDIYTADGQLKGVVAPPDEILHYLGQPSWFMRDANFAADFPMTARRLEWFLEKETGQNVDGVVAVNLGAVQKMLAATGPIELPSSKEQITAENFFAKTEYAAEINFFPGSTQKRDFLGEVAQVLLGRLTGGGNNWPGLAGQMMAALEEKDVLFYLNSSAEEMALDDGGWGGVVTSRECRNCFMVVEANFGANKANYFVKRKMEIKSVFSKGGDVSNEVAITFQNDSPSESWPGGKYKNYVRLLVPENSRQISVDGGDSRVASFSGILTAEALAKLGSKEQLVLVKDEVGWNFRQASPSAMKSIGLLLEVPTQEKRTVRISYQVPLVLDFGKKEVNYQLEMWKQPGVDWESLNLGISYPDFLSPVRSEEPGWVAGEGQVTYNSPTGKKVKTDQKLTVHFINSNQ